MRKTIYAVTKASFTITANFLTQSLGYYFCSQQENRHLDDAMTRVRDTFPLPSAASRASLVERWLVFWRDEVEQKYSRRDQTGL